MKKLALIVLPLLLAGCSATTVSVHDPSRARHVVGGRFAVTVPANWSKHHLADGVESWSTPSTDSMVAVVLGPIDDNADAYSWNITGAIDAGWKCRILSETYENRIAHCDSPVKSSTMQCVRMGSMDHSGWRVYSQVLLPGSCATNGSGLSSVADTMEWV